MTVADILRAVVEHRHDQDRGADARTSSSPTRCARSGSGEPTAVDFPGQAAGLLLDPSHYYDTGLASTAIGYGVAVTGMQMLDAYVTIANGGVTPAAAPARRDDRREGRAPRRAGRRRAAGSCRRRPRDEMTAMLTGVVSDGTGACAAIPGYTIAGKTGTAQKAVQRRLLDAARWRRSSGTRRPRTRSSRRSSCSTSPRASYGGTAAAPVFADVMQFALTHYGVAPDDVAQHAVQRGARVGRRVGHRRAPIRAAAAAHAARRQRRPRHAADAAGATTGARSGDRHEPAGRRRRPRRRDRPRRDGRSGADDGRAAHGCAGDAR